MGKEKTASPIENDSVISPLQKNGENSPLATLGNKIRQPELDMMKGLAIIFVMLRHINEFTGVTTYGGVFGKIFCTFSEAIMILFFLCSGYVYKSKGSILMDIGKKAKQLLISLAIYLGVVAAVYFVRYVVVEGYSFAWYAENMVTCVFGVPGESVIHPDSIAPNPFKYGVAPFWFLHQLFPASCLFIIVRKVTEKKPMIVKALSAFVLMLLATVAVYFDFQHSIADFFASHVPYMLNIINIIGIAGVLMIGSILKDIKLFDIGAYPKRFVLPMAGVSLIIIAVLMANYSYPPYAFQLGAWGQYGVFDIVITTLGGFCLTYFLAFCFYYAKKIKWLQKSLGWLGQNTLPLLMLHCIIAETICYIGGFWHDVYHETYPQEDFSMIHWAITVVATFAIMGLIVFFINSIKKGKKKKTPTI